MNIIFADSRGGNMKKQLHKTHTHTAPIYTYPGANITYLCQQAIQFIQQQNTPMHDTHIYIIGGICDITYKDKDRAQHYEETTFTDTPKHAAEKTIHTINHTYTQILEAGATPCFATIAPMSIDTWNNTRLTQHKTSYLLHHNHYSDIYVQELDPQHHHITHKQGHIQTEHKAPDAHTKTS